MQLKKIATIYTDFPSKFGIPRQSGMTKSHARIVFEREYRDESALRGIEEYSHLWLLWHFSQVKDEGWRPTVRPPRLGGNKRMGVFATRSPYRPNPVGLSSVRLEAVVKTEGEGTVLLVSGADLMDGTPIFDIKPYLAFTDSHPEAVCGFADRVYDHRLAVELAPGVADTLTQDKLEQLIDILSLDPRPSYQEDAERVYGMTFAGCEVKFRVDGDTLYLDKIERI